MDQALHGTRDALLTRRGLLFVDGDGPQLPDKYVRAVELELAQLGYVISQRLRDRLRRLELGALTDLKSWTLGRIAAHLGAAQKHEPLFRKFPQGTPEDTEALWIRRVLVHFAQAPDQACLFCRRVGTTQVLEPCHHVVCDHCFDGSNYSACPVCEQHVDRTSPFFEPTPYMGGPSRQERIVFELIDLGEDLTAAAKALFAQLCARTQALSPDDRAVLEVLLAEHPGQALSWVPDSLPVRENVATVLGVLFRSCPPQDVLPVAEVHLKTATDVLRFIAVYSGAHPALQGETVTRVVQVPVAPGPLVRGIANLLGREAGPSMRKAWLPRKIYRFRVAKLSRQLRRTLLALMERFDPDRLTEDMLRHRSYWVWIGEHLHPHEYAKRFPNVARAFAVVRKKAPDGTPAPAFSTFAAKVEAAAQAGDAAQMADLSRARPGDLGRRLDHMLRIAGDDAAASAHVLAAFTSGVPRMAPPVLLTLAAALPTRLNRAPVRVFWPKGGQAEGVSAPDNRAPLPAALIDALVSAISQELLIRISALPAFESVLIDEQLRRVVAPFNERTAARSAVALPRGSTVPVPEGKIVRLFLHWCEPEKEGHTTDLDLSVAFYDQRWTYVGVCSYYELKFAPTRKNVIAQSAGDLQSAPFPHGASEFVDVYRDKALAHGIRYAVMVVNAYAGLPFDLLDRAFAGVMLRDDALGAHFDPRTVELKFALQGQRGVYLPLVLDLAQDELRWLDLYRKGMFAMNNVHSSRRDIQSVCPDMISYFDSGVRMSMLDLAMLHAAARGQRVFIRDGGATTVITRAPAESASAFLGRIRFGIGAEPASPPPADGPAILAALYRGDIDLPAGSAAYALFRERVSPTLSAGDLIAF